MANYAVIVYGLCGLLLTSLVGAQLTETACACVGTQSSVGTPTATCDNGPCNNGTCVYDRASVGDFPGVCRCFPYFDNSTVDPDTCTQCIEGYNYVVNDGRGYCVQANPCKDNLCQFGGSCVVSASGYKCDCPFPYAGDTCGECVSGYTFDEVQQACVQSQTPCLPNPCQNIPNRQVCVAATTDARATCRCNEGFVPNMYSGEWACVPANSVDCPIDCGLHGVCMNTTVQTAAGIQISFYCRCQSGYVSVPTPTDFTNGLYFTWYKACAACDQGYIPDEAGNCVRDTTTNPCAGVNCGVHGRCVALNKAYSCECEPGFAFDPDLETCSLCAEGYANGPTVAGVDTDCSVCADGYVKVNGRCVQSSAGPPPCPECNFGTCVNVTVNNGYLTTCRCNPGYTNTATGEFCKICINSAGDATNNCQTTTDINTCNFLCMEKDPNSVCVIRRDSDGTVIGVGCECAPRFVKDETGLCNLCNPAWYSVTEPCDTPRCPLNCNQGKCVVKRTDSDTFVYGCDCADGWTGDLCDTPVVTPCDCPAPRICVTYTESINGQLVSFRKCGCKPGFQDVVDLRTGAVIPCGMCVKGRTGPNCDIDVVPENPACDTVRCPANTYCQVYTDKASNETKVGCFCKNTNQLYDATTNCGITDTPTNPCDRIECKDPNAICVPAAEAPTRARCICKRGFRQTDLNGEKICVPVVNGPCERPCGPREECVSVPSFTSATISNVNKCKCIPNAVPKADNSGCDCVFPWAGEKCDSFINVCEKIRGTSLDCPPRTKCVPSRERPFYQCVCAGSNTGTDCGHDLCEGVNCPAGQICNRRGQCVCPEPLVLDAAGTGCVQKVVDDQGGDNDATCRDGDKCYNPPATRTLVDGVNTDSEKGVTLESNDGAKHDAFDVRVIKANGIEVCLKRQLTDNGEDIVNFGICFVLKGYKIYELPGNDPTVAGTLANTILLGADGFPINTFYKEIKNINDAKLARIVAEAEGAIARAEFFLGEKNLPAEDNGVSANTAFWLYSGVIPTSVYPGPNSRLCILGQLKVDGAIDGEFKVNDAERIANFFPRIGGSLSNAGPTFMLEGKVNIGEANYANIKYTFVPSEGGVVVEGCIEALMPDEWRLDPTTSVGTTFGVNTGSAASITASIFMILAALIVALL